MVHQVSAAQQRLQLHYCTVLTYGAQISTLLTLSTCTVGPWGFIVKKKRKREMLRLQIFHSFVFIVTFSPTVRQTYTQAFGCFLEEHKEKPVRVSTTLDADSSEVTIRVV